VIERSLRDGVLSGSVTPILDFLLEEETLRIIAAAWFVYLVLALASCGGGSTSSSSSSIGPNASQGPLAGNWQIILTQEVPAQNPIVQLPVSGFLLESNTSITGSVALPGNGITASCAGVGTVTGTLSGQNVSISVDESGSTLNLTGDASSDSMSMAGTYQSLAGGCTKTPTSGTWAAFQVPPLKGKFSGTLAGSTYMGALTGQNPVAAIQVAGTMTQSPNIGASNAPLTGAITAVGYPCFATASVSGTISGQRVYLSVFGFDGSLIGNLGIDPGGDPGVGGTPAKVSASSNGTVLTGIMNLGSTSTGPCPPLAQTGVENDSPAATLTFQ
jgi:hypothetical protein